MKRFLYLLMAFCLVQQALALGAQATFLSQDPDPVEPGEYVDLRWRIENVGSTDIDNLVVEIEPKYPFQYDTQEDRVKHVRHLTAELEGEKSVVLRYRARVDSNAVTGDEKVELHMIFPDGSAKIEEALVLIQSRELLLGIERIDALPPRPAPGNETRLTLELVNFEDVTAEDIDVELNLDALPIATVGGTSEQHLNTLRGHQRHAFNYTLAIGADAQSRLYQVPVNVDYRDKFGEEKSVSSQFGLPVEAPPEYVVNMRKSDLVLPDTPGEVVVSISNIGASDINYVSMEVQPTEHLRVLSNHQIYLGNLESDDYETAAFKLYVTEHTGLLELPLVLTYKDSYNRQREDTVRLPLTIYSRDEAIRYELIEERSRLPWILLLLVVGGLYYWYRKR